MLSYYEGDQGLPKDYAEALKWYKKAADRGYANAQYFMGVMYCLGKGVKKDFDEAFRWLSLAADQKYGLAQICLGFMFLGGMGVPQDNIQAYKWFNLGASQGEWLAIGARDQVSELMTKGQIAEAQRLSSEWLEKHPMKKKELKLYIPPEIPMADGSPSRTEPKWIIPDDIPDRDSELNE